MALIRGGSPYATDEALSTLRPVASGNVVDAAWDREGVLWFSRASGSEFDGCDLFREGAPTVPVWRYSDLAGAADRGSGLCSIEPGKKGELLFDTSNQTAGSSGVWTIDLATGAITEISPGYRPTLSNNAQTFLLTQHVYLSSGGSDDRLMSLDPAARKDHPVRVLGVPAGTATGPAAFSADGESVAVVYALTSGRPGIAVGPLRGPKTRLLVGDAQTTFEGLAWMAHDSAILALRLPANQETGDLIRVSAKDGRATVLATNVAGFAVR